MPRDHFILEIPMGEILEVSKVFEILGLSCLLITNYATVPAVQGYQ